METLIIWSFIGIVLLLVIVRDIYDRITFQKKEMARLIKEFGKKTTPVKKERWEYLDGYYKRHCDEEGLDLITWNDLDMDSLFQSMNYTHSSVGEEYLYYILRKNKLTKEEQDHLEETVTYFSTHAEERAQVEYYLECMGYTEKYSVYEYLDLLDELGKRSNFKHYLVDFLMLFCIVLIAFIPAAGIAGLVCGALYNIVTYFADKRLLEPYIICFMFILRMLNAAKKLSKKELEPIKEEQSKLVALDGHLKAMKKGMGILQNSNQPISSGNPLDVLFDYVKMSFHTDIILFNRVYAVLKKNYSLIDEMISIIGALESSIAISAFRESKSEEGWCVPEFTEEAQNLSITEGYHPLMQNAVRNSIVAKQGVLITGSNASGKSSFLKMVAVNAILAQSIHTVMAKAYCSSYFKVFSSMSLRDDLKNGDSYFMVEIKAIKRILDYGRGNKPVLCFVDEVLRGTNTVERIAASTQILKCLNTRGILCFAATHDIELTYLLEKDYNNYHFCEEIVGSDVVFQYKLMEGRANSRNAILLLKQMEYDDSITIEARDMVERFEKTGVWSLN